MPGRILPDDLLRRWTREGKTDREILDLLEQHLNISVTRQAISAWRKRRGMEMNSQPPQAMPWRLRPEHRAKEPARAIRLYARRERGDRIDPEDEVRLRRVEAFLRERGGVFDYDPDTIKGWIIVPRRDGVDTGIFRSLKSTPGPTSVSASTGSPPVPGSTPAPRGGLTCEAAMAKMTQDEALAALGAYRATADRRDELIRDAAAAGVPETQIAVTAGVARMTVRKALGKDVVRRALTEHVDVEV